jgi:hypothetical protein
LTVKPAGSPDGAPVDLPWSFAEDEALEHLELTHSLPVVEQPIEHMRASLAVESGAGGGAAGVTAPSKPGGAGATSTMIKPFLSECPAAARCGPPVRVLALGLVLGSGGRKGLSAGSAGVFATVPGSGERRPAVAASRAG